MNSKQKLTAAAQILDERGVTAALKFFMENPIADVDGEIKVSRGQTGGDYGGVVTRYDIVHKERSYRLDLVYNSQTTGYLFNFYVGGDLCLQTTANKNTGLASVDITADTIQEARLGEWMPYIDELPLAYQKTVDAIHEKRVQDDLDRRAAKVDLGTEGY